jgi:DNA-binding response OmpR family regulator
MLERCPILIVEDEPLIAMNLAMEVERLDGVVIGPTATVAEALAILEETPVLGAILDANLADCEITPVARLMWKRGIPFVLHSAREIPAQLSSIITALAYIPKPADAAFVIRRLWEQRCAGR